jgi:fructokinase
MGAGMKQQTDNENALTVVGLGEALFDCFPEGALLGGAPVNLAVQAQQLLRPLGGSAVVVSAVGQDELGERLRRELADREMSTQFVQETSEFPTGKVRVTVDEAGHPEFEIAEHVAWDHIRPTDSAKRLASRCAAICFGTLAQRSPESRSTIRQLLAAAPQAWRVCDLNLRQQFYSADVIAGSFQLANVMKLSAAELSLAAKLLDVNSSNDADQQARELCKKFELELLILTRGKEGTVLYGNGQRVEGEVPSFPRAPRADDVGAGDASCAAIVTGLLQAWPLERIVNLANRVGAYVASQPGATPRLPREILDLT